MRIFSILAISLLSNLCLAVGWEEVSKQTISTFNIKVKIEFDAQKNCYRVIAKLPVKLLFSEIGEREFWRVSYQKIEDKDKGWQLSPKGTQIELSTTKDGTHEKVGSLCLNSSDLNIAHLSAVYGGPSGTPPMVVIVNLSELR